MVVSSQVRVSRSVILSTLITASMLSAQWSRDPGNALIVGYGLNSDICSDGDGGAYITYEYPATFPRTTALVRVNRDGYQPWGASRSIVGERAQSAPAQTITDSRGGVIISFVDSDVIWPEGRLVSRVRVQRVDDTGNLLWGSTGIRVSTSERSQNTNGVLKGIVSDGSGGCIVVWLDSLNNLWTQRVNSLGARAWGDSGLHVAGRAYGPIWTEQDGSGGVVMSWLSQGPASWRIQRVSAAARVAWDSSGITLPCTINRLQDDGQGNVIAAGFAGSSDNILYVAQKIDSSGIFQWSLPYVALGEHTVSEYAGYPLTVNSGAGLVTFVWDSIAGSSTDSYSQILRNDGSGLFPYGGKHVSTAHSPKSIVGTLSSDSVTTINIWLDQRSPGGLYCQRSDTLGRALWDTNDVPLSMVSVAGPKVTSDGRGGCIVAGWREADFTVRAQQISRLGSLGQIIAGMGNKQPESSPLQFRLYQNYPNPFNPNTIIRYQLRGDSDVLLRVFDILGREILTLVNEHQRAGIYRVPVNANQWSGGVYFYQLRVGNFGDMKKLMILK